MAAFRTVVALANLFAFCALGPNCLGAALPTINTVSPPKPQEITGITVTEAPISIIPTKTGDVFAINQLAPALGQPSVSLLSLSASQSGPLQSKATPTTSASGQSSATTASVAAGKGRSITAEKLKRGLTNFMNNLNPAPYFVPPQEPLTGVAASQATVIRDVPTAEAVIKGPTRLTRPLGSPLRWGR